MATSKIEQALTTIETVERLAVHAYAAAERLDTRETMRLLAEIAGATTTTTCSLVKDQKLSDRISVAARARTEEIGVFRAPVLSEAS